MTISKRERTLIVIVAILAVICLYYVFFLKPHLDEMQQVNSSISDNEALIYAREQQKVIIQNLDGTIVENEQKAANMSAGITQGFDQPPVLVYLKKTISDNANKLMFTFGNLSQAGQMVVCPVSITMTSSYEGIKNILAELNNDQYFIKVTALSIMAGADSAAATVPVADGTLPAEIITAPNNLLEVKLDVEFYSFSVPLPEDTAYSFGDGYQYGGDIFN